MTEQNERLAALMNKISEELCLREITRTAGWGCAGRAYKPDHMITGSVGARTHAC